MCVLPTAANEVRLGVMLLQIVNQPLAIENENNSFGNPKLESLSSSKSGCDSVSAQGKPSNSLIMPQLKLNKRFISLTAFRRFLTCITEFIIWIKSKPVLSTKF